jgi:hypothetical protein
VVGEQFGWPVALQRAITVSLGIGFIAAVILAWYHGERGHQRITRTETLFLFALGFAGTGALVSTVSVAPGARPGPAPAAALSDVDRPIAFDSRTATRLTDLATPHVVPPTVPATCVPCPLQSFVHIRVHDHR